MKNKNTKMAILAGIGFVASFFASTGVYAADPQITINNGSENLYVASGTKASVDGTASYDSITNTITLNNFHGDDIKVSNLESIIISLQGENTISMNTLDSNQIPQGINAGTAELTITGKGILKINRESLDGFKNSGTVVRANNIIIDYATLDLTAPTKACLIADSSWTANSARGDITINSGTLRLNCDTAMRGNNITINGGSTEVFGSFSSMVTMTKNLTVNSGKLTINADSINLGSAMTFNNMKINGGEINIHGGQFGIQLTDLYGTFGSDGHFIISGGKLTIDNVDTGIYVGDAEGASDDSFIEFSGGTTIIDSRYGVAEIIYNDENDKNIIIGNNMNLHPEDLSVKMEFTDYSGVWQEYVYYLALNGSAAKNAIITDEDDVDPDDEDVIPDDTPVPDTADDTTNDSKEEKKKTPKASDTGGNTKDNSFVLSMFAVIPLTIAIISLMVHFTKNRSHRVDFN